jgi:hypothetical protein
VLSLERNLHDEYLKRKLVVIGRENYVEKSGISRRQRGSCCASGERANVEVCQ